MSAGKLSKVEKFYIEKSDKPLKEIASDLGRAEKTIKKHLDSLLKTKVNKNIKKDPLKNKSDCIHRIVKGKRTKVPDSDTENDNKSGLVHKTGITIMTKAGSEHGDEAS